MRSLLVLAALAGVAHADDFAQPAVKADDLAWAVTAKCDAGNDIEQRQCRAIRDEALKRYAGRTVLVEGDPAALTVGAWDPQKRSVSLELAGCVACSGALRIAGNATLYDSAKVFADEGAATRFGRSLSNVRVQMLVKLPAKPRVDGGTLPVEITGYRVITPCNGAIVIANLPSGPIAADRRACVPTPP